MSPCSVCGKMAGFARFEVSAGIWGKTGTWYCPDHLPKDFLPTRKTSAVEELDALLLGGDKLEGGINSGNT